MSIANNLTWEEINELTLIEIRKYVENLNIVVNKFATKKELLNIIEKHRNVSLVPSFML